MGGQQSKVHISLPPKQRRCFPAYDNEPELYETAKQIEECHLQAVKLASWLASTIASPYNTSGHFAFTAATVLFTFLLHRVKSSSANSDIELEDLCNNNNGVTRKQGQSRASLEVALINSKVSAAIAKKSVCELQAKMCVISNRYQRLLSRISVEERRLEVVPVIQTCEEVLQLFHNSTHVFRLNPLVSSPFLVTFAGIFVAVSELSIVLIPSYKGPIVGQMNLLSETLSIYKTACMQARMENIKFRRLTPESMLEVVARGITTDINYVMIDACLEGVENRDRQENFTDSNATDNEDEMDRIYQNANEAVTAYRSEVEEEYNKFFKTGLDTISKFSGFRSNTSENGPGQENTS